ncbi:hypothetical protein Y1Q_0011807 [Alligator mississippiensis]|uniref:Uncharacterized protein n=1 Tax=Alligator mississippiensis TaxID=8496 RepID=A0A151M162_ALLMI|nr:hypothetical protein Y1Q_0011807 [Alligator mississippiensis]
MYQPGAGGEAFCQLAPAPFSCLQSSIPSSLHPSIFSGYNTHLLLMNMRDGQQMKKVFEQYMVFLLRRAFHSGTQIWIQTVRKFGAWISVWPMIEMSLSSKVQLKT